MAGADKLMSDARHPNPVTSVSGPSLPEQCPKKYIILGGRCQQGPVPHPLEIHHSFGDYATQLRALAGAVALAEMIGRSVLVSSEDFFRSAVAGRQRSVLLKSVFDLPRLQQSSCVGDLHMAERDPAQPLSRATATDWERSDSFIQRCGLPRGKPPRNRCLHPRTQLLEHPLPYDHFSGNASRSKKLAIVVCRATEMLSHACPSAGVMRRMVDSIRPPPCVSSIAAKRIADMRSDADRGNRGVKKPVMYMGVHAPTPRDAKEEKRAASDPSFWQADAHQVKPLAILKLKRPKPRILFVSDRPKLLRSLLSAQADYVTVSIEDRMSCDAPAILPQLEIEILARAAVFAGHDGRELTNWVVALRAAADAPVNTSFVRSAKVGVPDTGAEWFASNYAFCAGCRERIANGHYCTPQTQAWVLPAAEEGKGGRKGKKRKG